MPITTPHFLLEAFLDGDSYSAIADKRRFSTVDNQLNRLAELIGDGRINGWEVVLENFPGITVTAGSGLVNKFYVNTFNDQQFELSPNSKYFLYVQHKTGIVGTIGAKSDVKSITYTDLSIPETPENFTATATSSTVSLSWENNTDPDFSHYIVERSTDGGSTYSSVTTITSAGTTTFTDEADEDTAYIYRIKAVDLSGFESSPNIAIISTPLSTELPPNPINVLMPYSESAINVLWKRPPNIVFSKIAHWKIEYVRLNTDNSDIQSSLRSIIVNRSLLYERIDDLNIGQRYKVTLRTVDTKGRESSGVVMNITPQPNLAPRDPQAIAFTMQESPSGVQVNLTWTDGDTPYDSAITYRYKIYVTVDGENESAGIDVPIGFSEEQISLYTFNYLDYFAIPENKIVTFRLTALDVSGFESFGSYLRVETAIFTEPLRLGNLSSTFDADNAQIIVSWDINEDTADIQMQIGDTDLEEPYLGETIIFNDRIGRNISYVLKNTELNHKYVFVLTPYNTEDTAGPSSTTIELTTIPGGLPLPQPPESIEIDSGDRQLQIVWTSSKDFYTSNYRIYRKVDSVTLEFEDWTLWETVPKDHPTTFTDYGLTNDQTYSYYITSVDIYGRESEHLSTGSVNLNFVEGEPRQAGVLTHPTNVLASLSGGRILLTWDALLEEFDAFTIYRSMNNKYSWEKITSVDRNTFSYLDIALPLINNTTFYYTIDKTINDADVIVQSTDSQPEKSIFLAEVTTTENGIDIDVSLRRDIANMADPLGEYTSGFILPHKHLELDAFDPSRIDLNPSLIITDWSTIDGRIFTTSAKDIQGTSYIVKVNDRIPVVFYTVDPINRRLIFAEAIVEIDPNTNTISGDVPSIEVKVLGIEEVTGTLDNFRFDNLHARQIQFGTLNKEQLPDIHHDGRIRERLLPDRFLLERFSNHSFVVPQNNTDDTKTFGDGTTFFATIAADGNILEVVDFDLADDGDIVAFNKPSFSSDTIQNLKQNSITSAIASGFNIANHYLFQSLATLWINDPDTIVMGRVGGSDDYFTDVYLRYTINIPVGASLASTVLEFSAASENASSGSSVRFRISILDPTNFSDSVDLQFETISVVSTVGSVFWSPDTWNNGEISNATSVDITPLIKLFIENNGYYSGRPVIIKISATDAVEIDNYRIADADPVLKLSYVIDTAEVNSDPGGFQSEKSYHFSFEFADNDPKRWVRITTFNADRKPNPIIDLNKRLRFRILTGKSIYLGVGVREISGDGVVGENGGEAGPIEWTGITSTIISDDATTPVGIRIQGSEDWQEFDIDFRKTTIVSFQNGNNSLAADFGVLEHLFFTLDPESSSPPGPFDIYIDKIEQISDLIVAGTSQGILYSDDFGTSWQLSRLTDTPVHQFYRGNNNQFLWAISSNEVFLAVDPQFWFVPSGTTGIQFIRNITEDEDGNMFISTDRGVYWLEIGIINTFASFRQTQPITALTTDCYALWHDGRSNEILVSTEIGVFKTNNKGETWQNAGLSTEGFVAYKVISSPDFIPTLVAINRKHILRKLPSDSDFQSVFNFEEEFGIFDIWDAEIFNGKMYVSTGKGVFRNSEDIFTDPAPVFEKALADLDINNQTRVAFGLDVVDIGNLGTRLFIGQENRIVTLSSSGAISIRKEFKNKELPSFYKDDTEVITGFVYNAFNKVVSFREPVPANVIISAARIPRRTFVALNSGWAETKSDAEIFIHVNGMPTWLDFALDTATITNQIKNLSADLDALPALTDFNSNPVDANKYLELLRQDITALLTSGPEGSPLINNTTISKLLEDLKIFLYHVSSAVALLIPIPNIAVKGIPTSQRPNTAKANTLEEQNDFTASNSVGIEINSENGTVDFRSAFAQSTSSEARGLYAFNKFDYLSITIFGTNVFNIGEFTHPEIEDTFEYANTGLSSSLSKSVYTNMIKSGIFLEARHDAMFDIFNISRIQSRFNSADDNDWYDVLNSTIDFESIGKTESIPQPTICTSLLYFSDTNKLWIGTDSDIFEYLLSTTGAELLRVIRPGSQTNTKFIWDMYKLNDTIYIVSADNSSQVGLILSTTDNGTTWTDIETINLPNTIYSFRIINGNQVVSTKEGIFYSDNTFGTWYPATLSVSNVLGSDSPSIQAFTRQNINLAGTNFIIAESDRWFYISGNGPEFLSLGRITNNNCSVVSRVFRFKNLTWVGTDKGLYVDNNTILSDSVNFALQVEMEGTVTASSQINVNDIISGGDAIFCSTNQAKIYRYLDEDEDDDVGNTWKSYQVPNCSAIHKIVFAEISNNDYIIAASYNKIKIINVTQGSGAFG